MRHFPSFLYSCCCVLHVLIKSKELFRECKETHQRGFVIFSSDLMNQINSKKYFLGTFRSIYVFILQIKTFLVMLKHATLEATDSPDPISQNMNIKNLFTSSSQEWRKYFLGERKCK